LKIESGREGKEVESGKLKVESEREKKGENNDPFRGKACLTPTMPQQPVKARLTPTTGQGKACRTTGISETEGRGIAKEPLEAKQDRKINKTGKKHAKRIRGKP
jgi:hypothetical protein